MTFKEIPATKSSISRRKNVHGVGVNDSWYVVKPTIFGVRYACPYYQKWSDMISRCYSAKTQAKHLTYSGCTVCDEWLLFSNFKRWMKGQDWEGKELDKDLLEQGNKVYSPDKCMFVSSEINSIFTDHGSARGDCMLGVVFHRGTGKFRAFVNKYGKRIEIGLFKLEVDAHNAYLKEKYAHIKAVAASQSEPLATALLRYRITTD